MTKILDFIADNTGGQTYKSFKFRFEKENTPAFAYDDKSNIIFKRDRNGETDKSIVQPISMEQKAKDINQSGNLLFKYFLDGSRKTYKVDDIAYDKRIYPIIAGQIGVGCCYRPTADVFKNELLEKHLVLTLPMCADKDMNPNERFFHEILDYLNRLSILQKNQLHFTEVLAYSDRQLELGKTYENRGIARIQNRMMDLEKKIVKELARSHKLNRNSYLLKDGSLEYSEERSTEALKWHAIKNNYRSVVGVSKAFNPELCKNNRGQNIAKDIADMPLFYRTPAYKYQFQEVLFSVWYLRLQPQNRTIGPFSGVVKVEKILVTEEEQERGLESSEIDEISANLLNERNPSCYGKDRRWANHLYPVYLTESFIKSQYISDAYFINLF